MTSFTWKGVSGDWNDPNNWTPAGGPPTSADDAAISGSPGADIITVDSADAANSLALSDTNATLNIDGASASLSLGSLTMSDGALNISSLGDGGLLALDGGTLDQTGGTLTLGRYGTISDATIDEEAGGAFHWQGGTLSGIDYEGALSLINGRAGHVAGGLTMSGSSGSGPGTINVDGGSHLYFDGTQTVSNATINLGSDPSRAYLRETDTAGAGDQVLTLASNVTIDVTLRAGITSGAAPGDGIINDGAIEVIGGRGDLFIRPTTFVNNGTIEVGGADSVRIFTAVTGKGTDTIAGGTLAFYAGVSTAATPGDQDVAFGGAGLLRLNVPLSFYGEISDFAARDQINLAGFWSFSALSQAGGMTTLTLSNGSTTHGFEFVGDYVRHDFSIDEQSRGITTVKFA